MSLEIIIEAIVVLVCAGLRVAEAQHASKTLSADLSLLHHDIAALQHEPHATTAKGS
jgi:hypothetical protein